METIDSVVFLKAKDSLGDLTKNFKQKQNVQKKIKYFQNWLSGNHLKNVKHEVYKKYDKKEVPVKTIKTSALRKEFIAPRKQSLPPKSEFEEQEIQILVTG